ncbi:MAG: hypothetical protein QOJ98_3459 [Acidobacteriota bacterium]|nr:hypothetical protein [Acidobacteriota bacterium]
MFAATVVALEAGDLDSFLRAAQIVDNVPEVINGVASALGWVSRDRLAGIGLDLLTSQSPVRRRLGLAACRLHGADPGPTLLAGLRDADAGVRAEALRTAGVLGRQDLVSACTAAASDDDPNVQFWAAWSSVLLGNRTVGLDALTRMGETQVPHRARAFGLSLQAMSTNAAHRVLQDLAKDPKQLRWLIQGAGITGDPTYVSWLIGHMDKNETTRLAGEAFSLLTGLDLAVLDLERKPPEDFESGPNDDPDDPNVDMDADDGLPWPDPERITKWWAANGNRFQSGIRYFMGAPVTREHCIDVLKNGYQRQRILAAHYLCLLDPGTPLFNTSAPAWRQQRLLAKMG